MNYLQIQEARKTMTPTEYAKILTALVVDNESDPVAVAKVEQHKEPYATHLTVTVQRAYRKDSIVSFRFTLAGWYGASVQNVHHVQKTKYNPEEFEITLGVHEQIGVSIVKIRVQVSRFKGEGIPA